jgi:hypothetical protein
VIDAQNLVDLLSVREHHQSPHLTAIEITYAINPISLDPRLDRNPDWIETQSNEGLENPAMGADRSQMARRIHEPESLPFINHCSQVIRSEQQLLNASLWPSRVDRHKAAHRGRETACKYHDLH